MASITETLVSDHAVFIGVFGWIKQVLPRLTTLGEVKLLAGLVEALLRDHADVETDLAFIALDHALYNKGQLNRLHEDHDEIDDRLKQVQTAANLSDARRLLRLALLASRQHFRREERIIFPLIEKVLQKETLTKLGGVRMRQYLARGR
jgi:iron-sulfur cluster repair protein YtfE (RIC family)